MRHPSHEHLLCIDDWSQRAHVMLNARHARAGRLSQHNDDADKESVGHTEGPWEGARSDSGEAAARPASPNTPHTLSAPTGAR